MLDGNTAALNRHMDNEDRAERLFNIRLSVAKEQIISDKEAFEEAIGDVLPDFLTELHQIYLGKLYKQGSAIEKFFDAVHAEMMHYAEEKVLDGNYDDVF